MPTLDWLKTEFSYGYDSGDVLSPTADEVRRREEESVGGSYRDLFLQGAVPHLKPDSVVLEFGPGRGSWTRALLQYVPQGCVHTVDFQDVRPYLQPEKYAGRLVCHQVSDNSFSCVEDGAFDFAWSFGVLCHNNLEQIEIILRHMLPKLKPGACAVHEHADWEKLERFGWERGGVPSAFKTQPDNAIWWPRNDQAAMRRTAERAGWQVLSADLGVIQRDSVIVLRRP